MQFLIRDDDTSYFTTPDSLEVAFGSIWGQLPISLAVVPFHAGLEHPGIPTHHWEKIMLGDKGLFLKPPTPKAKVDEVKNKRYMAIGDNRELVLYLREKIREGNVEILLHGYSHEMFDGLPEFVGGANLRGKVKEGREYLEKIFETKVTTFVPPWNQLSNEGLNALIAERMNLLTTGDVPLRPLVRTFGLKTLMHLMKRSIYRLSYEMSKGSGRPYPFVIDLPAFKQLGCYSFFKYHDSASLIQEFEKVKSREGNFCLATHYWELHTPQGQEKLQGLISYCREQPNVRFQGVDQNFRRNE